MATNFLELEGFYDVVASSVEHKFEIKDDCQISHYSKRCISVILNNDSSEFHKEYIFPNGWTQVNFNNPSRSTSGILSLLTMTLRSVDILQCPQVMFDQCRNQGAHDFVWFLDSQSCMDLLQIRLSLFAKCLMESSNLGCFCSDWYLEWLLAVPCAGGIIAPLNYRWVCVILKCSHRLYCLHCHLQFM